MPKKDGPFKINLVGNEKGGQAKTSLCIALAVARARAGYPVILVDTDLPQATASTWAAMRLETGHQPPIVCVQKTGKLGADLVQLRENYEVFVDAGGRDSIELRQSVVVADRWLIPVIPAQFDLISISKMRQLYREVLEKVGRVPATLLLLSAIPHNTRDEETALEMLTEAGVEAEIPIAQARLKRRAVWNKAAMSWCTVPELTGKMADQSANEEIEQLYAEFFGEPFHVAA